MNVAGQMAEKKNDRPLAELLRAREGDLERSILAREDTLCNENMTNAERRWLAEYRPDHAKRWNVLTNLLPRDLTHY